MRLAHVVAHGVRIGARDDVHADVAAARDQVAERVGRAEPSTAVVERHVGRVVGDDAAGAERRGVGMQPTEVVEPECGSKRPGSFSTSVSCTQRIGPSNQPAAGGRRLPVCGGERCGARCRVRRKPRRPWPAGNRGGRMSAACARIVSCGASLGAVVRARSQTHSRQPGRATEQPSNRATEQPSNRATELPSYTNITRAPGVGRPAQAEVRDTAENAERERCPRQTRRPDRRQAKRGVERVAP